MSVEQGARDLLAAAGKVPASHPHFDSLFWSTADVLRAIEAAPLAERAAVVAYLRCPGRGDNDMHTWRYCQDMLAITIERGEHHAALLRSAALRSSASRDEVLEEARNTFLSEWTDRDMLVDGREFKAGQVTIVDILDHAARAAKVKAEVRAELHDWENKRNGACQCRRCGAVTFRHEELKTKCPGSISAAIQDRNLKRPEGERGG